MASMSDRSLFLEAAKTEALTINTIVERFGCSANTARVWVKNSNIEQVPDSWPPAYRHKNTFADAVPAVEVPTKQSPNEYVIKWPRPPKAALEELFDKVLDGDVDNFDFTDQFQRAESAEHLRSIKVSLMTGLLLVEHYEKIRKDEGMD